MSLISDIQPNFNDSNIFHSGHVLDMGSSDRFEPLWVHHSAAGSEGKGG